jgi:hypothetical protein
MKTFGPGGGGGGIIGMRGTDMASRWSFYSDVPVPKTFTHKTSPFLDISHRSGNRRSAEPARRRFDACRREQERSVLGIVGARLPAQFLASLESP